MVNLIRESFEVSAAWTAPTAPLVLPEPPNRVTQDGIGFYLYHVAENNHYKNLPPPGRDIPPVRFTPMGLNLYYQLTANDTRDDGTAALQEQLMMGIAIKALHDNPEVNEDTMVNGLQVMPAAIRGRDNLFKITLQPLPYNEAVQYWTAGNSPLKLSAYYELSVVLLEPEETQRRVARVLSFGAHVFTQGAPRLMGSQNTISFVFQAQNRFILLQPAQAPPIALAAPPAANSLVSFLGTGLSGDSLQLLLLNARWVEPRTVGPAWGVDVQGDLLSFTLREMARLQAPASPDTEPVLPGIYAVQLRVTRQRINSVGATVQIEHLSNQCPFAVTPRIDGIAPVAPARNFTVNGYIFQHADLPTEAVQVYMADTRLERVVGAPAAGQFSVASPSQLQVQVPAAYGAGETLPIRIFVNGAESAPRWITTS